MEKIKVNKIIICKQEEKNENYEQFKRIVKEKKINVIVVKKRRRNFNREKFKFSNFMAQRGTSTRKYFK